MLYMCVCMHTAMNIQYHSVIVGSDVIAYRKAILFSLIIPLRYFENIYHSTLQWTHLYYLFYRNEFVFATHFLFG